MSSSLSRREFLRIAGGTASAGLVFLLLKPRSASVNIKPPGALPEPNFSALCLRCGKCASACEQQAVRIDHQGFPYIDGISIFLRPHIDEHRCNGCSACVNVCPQAAQPGGDIARGKAVSLKPIV